MRVLLRHIFRALVLLLVIASAAVLLATLSVTDGTDRLKKFLYHAPQVCQDYQGMVAAQRTATGSMSEGTVVFLGDSRMRDLDLSGITKEPVLNLSIGGDTTAGLLFRVPQYFHFERSSLVVIAVGINDLTHFSDEKILDNYDELLRDIRQNGAKKIAVCSIIPIDPGRFEPSIAGWIRGHETTNVRIASFNELFRIRCLQHPAVFFVETCQGMVNSQGDLKPEFSRDGLHFTEAGNSVLKNILKTRLPFASIPQ